VNAEETTRDGEHPPRSDLEREHSKLRGDIELVRTYGEAHPDEWVDLWFENEPSVRIVTLFVGDDVDEHESALRNLLEHPERLVVRRSDLYSRTYLEEVNSELQRLATSTEKGAFTSWGIGRGRLNVAIRAGRQDLAQQLLESFGDAVELRVGFLRYPEPALGDSDSRRRSTPEREQLSLLPPEVTVSVDDGLEVRSGDHLSNILHVSNGGTDEIVIMTNGNVTARIVDPKTGDVVGAYEFAQTAVGIPFRVPPHGSVDVPLLVGTASTNSHLGYCVPPGHWAIDVSLNLVGRGDFRSPLLPIDVVA
jgi:hypothetical protein